MADMILLHYAIILKPNDPEPAFFYHSDHLGSPVVLDLQSNTIYYQDLQSANIFVANNFHLMRNERLAKTDSKS